MDYAYLEFLTLNLQHQHHRCKSHKRTLFSHKEILLVFALIGAINLPITGCDDTENFQKNSKYLSTCFLLLLFRHKELESQQLLGLGDYTSFKSDFYFDAVGS